MPLLLASGGGSYAVGPTSGGKVYAFNNLTTSPIQVAPANPNRTGINFYNPGAVNVLAATVDKTMRHLSATLLIFP